MPSSATSSSDVRAAVNVGRPNVIATSPFENVPQHGDRSATAEISSHAHRSESDPAPPGVMSR